MAIVSILSFSIDNPFGKNYLKLRLSKKMLYSIST